MLKKPSLTKVRATSGAQMLIYLWRGRFRLRSTVAEGLFQHSAA